MICDYPVWPCACVLCPAHCLSYPFEEISPSQSPLSAFPEHMWQVRMNFCEWQTLSEQVIDIHLDQARVMDFGRTLHPHLSLAARRPERPQTSCITLERLVSAAWSVIPYAVRRSVSSSRFPRGVYVFTDTFHLSGLSPLNAPSCWYTPLPLPQHSRGAAMFTEQLTPEHETLVLQCSWITSGSCLCHLPAVLTCSPGPRPLCWELPVQTLYSSHFLQQEPLRPLLLPFIPFQGHPCPNMDPSIGKFAVF